MKYKTSEFECTRTKYTIRGTQFIPEGENLPIVIVSHEFLTGEFSVHRYARRFASWGFAAFCFDFVGGSLLSLRHRRMTVWSELEDLKAVIRYAQQRPETDKTRVYLMGCSQGGLVSALAAARMPEEIDGLILFYPALSIPDDARAGNMIFNTQFDTDNIPETIKCGPFIFSGDYPKTVMDMDVFEEISKYRGKVLIIHGTGDKIVDHSYSVRAAEVYAPGKCRLVLLPKAGHIFAPVQDLPAIREMKRFVTEEFSS